MPIGLRPIAIPDFGSDTHPPVIPAATYALRCDSAIQRAETDWLVIYADREHFANMMFLTGFEPRFEEALLLLGPNQQRILIVGNECQSYTVVAGLQDVRVLLCQSLSLMGQDRSHRPSLVEVLREAGIGSGDQVGLVGWKYLEAEEWNGPTPTFFAPAIVVDALRCVVGSGGRVIDATEHLMHPETGLRAIIDADQIAAFEWAATRSSLAVWRIVSGIRADDSEFAAAARMGYEGDPANAHTMLASAPPGGSVIGLRSPSARLIRRGDGVTACVSFWGGLSSRAGLLADRDDSFLAIATAYFRGLLSWYQTAEIGVQGGLVFDAVAEALGSGGLRSALNPGHLTGHDEWMHTPIRPHSTERVASGMPFQVDIIPMPLPGGAALNCEDAVTFADAALRDELRQRHPAVHARIEARRRFMRDVLGVPVKDSVLPMSAVPMCLPPFWLAPNMLLTGD